MDQAEVAYHHRNIVTFSSIIMYPLFIQPLARFRRNFTLRFLMLLISVLCALMALARYEYTVRRGVNVDLSSWISIYDHLHIEERTALIDHATSEEFKLAVGSHLGNEADKRKLLNQCKYWSIYISGTTTKAGLKANVSRRDALLLHKWFELWVNETAKLQSATEQHAIPATPTHNQLNKS